MKNKGIIFLLIALAVVIVGVIAAEYLTDRPGRRPPNPYELEMDSIASVDPALVLYREIKNLKLKMEVPAGISLINNKIAVVGDQNLLVTDITGTVHKEIQFDVDLLCIQATPDRYYLGSPGQIIILDSTGVQVGRWETGYETSLITSIHVSGDKIFVADAGKRLVYRLSKDGQKEVEFDGKRDSGTRHGFIVPSPNFDLAVDPSGELWVANPGRHALENYTFDGKLRGWWEAVSADISGFSGCCNPAHFTFLPDGNFVTSEKGVVCIKIYKPSGELAGVVAAPADFEEELEAPDVVADETGRIYALDVERKMIRIFERKQP